MATNIQRAQSIADAILNKTATASQVNRLGQALAFNAGFLPDYELLTNSEKAAFLVARIRHSAIRLVKQMDASQAIDAATANTDSAVDVEFEEG